MVKMNWGPMSPTLATAPTAPVRRTRGGPDAGPGPSHGILLFQVDLRPELREESCPDVGWTWLSADRGVNSSGLSSGAESVPYGIHQARKRSVALASALAATPT